MIFSLILALCAGVATWRFRSTTQLGRGFHHWLRSAADHEAIDALRLGERVFQQLGHQAVVSQRAVIAGESHVEAGSAEVVHAGRPGATAHSPRARFADSKTLSSIASVNLPVKVNGKVAYSITRHDLLRAWIGLGVDIENMTV